MIELFNAYAVMFIKFVLLEDISCVLSCTQTCVDSDIISYTIDLKQEFKQTLLWYGYFVR